MGYLSLFLDYSESHLTIKNKHMKQLLFIAIISILIIGCESGATPVFEKSNAKTEGQVTTTNGPFQTSHSIQEFEYKNHTYISCGVRDGISISHAGHCKCNNIE